MGSVELLEVSGLSIRYRGSSHPVIHNASFILRESERCGLVGDSGSGKTTLARAIAALLPRDQCVISGSIALKSEIGVGRSDIEARKSRIGLAYISQEAEQTLNPVLRIGTQIAEVVRACTPLRGQALRDRVQHLVASVALPVPETLDAYPCELSGGQQQRVVIAQALATKPLVLIADELTSALDLESEKTILDLLRTLQSELGFGLLLISHKRKLLQQFVHRIIHIENGKLENSALLASFK
jgi:ABC-type glutathione transport system ATPase component